MHGTFCWGKQVRENAPARANLDWLPGDAQLGIGSDSRLGVAGHLDLGHDGDLPRSGVGHEVAELVLRVEAAVGGAIVALRVARVPDEGLAAPGPDAGQLRVPLDLHPPALIVGQVQVQAVELVQRQQVDQRADLRAGEEVPGGVEHHPTPGKPGASSITTDGISQGRLRGAAEKMSAGSSSRSVCVP